MSIPLPSAIRGVVFDLDGTLVDSSADLAAALNTVLRTNGAEPISVEVVKTLVGEGAHKMVERALAIRDVTVEHDVYPAFRAAYRARIARETRPYPGAVHLMTGLRRRGVALGVCTNKPEDLAVNLVVSLGLGVLLDALVGGDTLDTKKPDPAAVLETLERMEIAPENAVLVGDSSADIAGGHAAGLATIGVTWGYGNIEGATHVVRNMAELDELLLPHLA